MELLLILIFLAVFLFWGAKNSKRPILKWRLGKAADALIKSQLSSVKVQRKIAVGNAGAVYLARLEGGWEENLGIRWITKCEIPEVIVLKLARFKGQEITQVDILQDLGREIYQNSQDNQSPPLCPFLAIGLIEVANSPDNFVVEIMPEIEGESLQGIIKAGKLKFENSCEVLNQLIYILNTAIYLDNLNFYTRNLDAENVIIQPDGKWIRIDFDNVSREDKKGAKRLRRLCKLSVCVLEQLDQESQTSNLLDLINKITATKRHLERTELVEGAAITTTSQLIDEIKAVQNHLN